MNYLEMVRKAPKKSEAEMWGSVEAVSELVEKLKQSHPEEARKFLMKEYGRMYGPHFGEELAREVVSGMWHYNAEGEKVQGEAVSVDDAVGYLVPDKAADWRWDAYVAANGFSHDLARTRLSRDEIMSAARAFWMEDDDFDGSKVFWYYSNK